MQPMPQAAVLAVGTLLLSRSLTSTKLLKPVGRLLTGGSQVELSSLGMHSTGAARQANWISAGTRHREDLLVSAQ